MLLETVLYKCIDKNAMYKETNLVLKMMLFSQGSEISRKSTPFQEQLWAQYALDQCQSSVPAQESCKHATFEPSWEQTVLANNGAPACGSCTQSL